MPHAHVAAASQQEAAAASEDDDIIIMGEPEHRFQQAVAVWSRYCPGERSANKVSTYVGT